jgi:tol-pal system protein YbgF
MWATTFEAGEYMKRLNTIRPYVTAALIGAALFVFAPVPSYAGTKEDLQALKDRVDQLVDMMQRLQSTVDSKMGVLQHLTEQTADNSNRVAAAMDDLQRKLATQNEALSGKVDTAAGQMQSVNDSIDEVKARLAKLDRSIQDLQTQIQNTQQQQQQQTAPSGGGGAPAPGPGAGGGMANNGGGAPAAVPAANPAPPLQETYQAGVRDYNSGKYQVAQSEFQDVVNYYPQDDMAGGAQFYLGEIAYKGQDYANAVKAYNAVLETFPNSSKAPAAQLHKGYALLLMNKKDAGVHELRALIQKHPDKPEAMQARSKLNGMGVRITATAPTRPTE